MEGVSGHKTIKHKKVIQFTAINDNNKLAEVEKPKDPFDAPLRECETLYNLALRSDLQKARQLYHKLLKHDLMQDSLFQESDNRTSLSQRITRLKFCALKNYAENLDHEYLHNKSKISAQDAIEYFQKIDSTDQSIWLKIGNLAISDEVNDLPLAENAFINALEDLNIFDNSIDKPLKYTFLSPNRKEALENLSKLLYDTGSFERCLNIVDKGITLDPENGFLNQLRYQLLNDTWVKLILPQNYYEIAPPIKKPINFKYIQRHIRTMSYISHTPMNSLCFVLNTYTWNDLGELLIRICDKIATEKCHKSDDSNFPASSPHIYIDLKNYQEKTFIDNDINGACQKRKRKDTTTNTDYTCGKSKVARYGLNRRARTKQNEQIDSFNRKRDEETEEFTNKIESIIKKINPEYSIRNKHPSEEVDRFLLFFDKLWMNHVSIEDHEAIIKEAKNNPRSKLSSDSSLYMFIPHTNPPPPDPYFDETQVGEMFVDSEDSDQEIKKKTLWLCRWPEGLKDIVRDIINRIYEQFIDMLSNTCSAWNGDDGNAAIMMDESETSPFQKRKQLSEILLAFFEFAIDSHISRSGEYINEDDNQATSSISLKTSLEWQLVIEDCEWSLISSNWNFSSYLLDLEAKIEKSIGDVGKLQCHYKKWKEWSHQLLTRYWWCKGKMSLFLKNPERAMSSFKELTLLTEINDILLTNSSFDPYINNTTINNKIDLLESQKDLPQDNWSRTILHFIDSVNFLLNCVSDNIDEDLVVQFWTTIHSINEALSKVTNAIKDGQSIELSTAEYDISEPLNVLCIRVWILFYYILRGAPSYVENDDFAEFLATVHDQLGARRICCSDNGSFLKFCLNTFAELDASENLQHEYQCCHCLYGVSLTIDAELPWDHDVPAIELDFETAKLIYRRVRNFISEKSSKTWVFKNDIKEFLDAMASIVEPPTDEKLKKCSYRTQHYLEDEICFYEAVQYQEHDHYINDLAAISCDEENDISDLYYFRGKILHHQFKSRSSKSNQYKAIELLEKAIEQFTLDYYICPLRYSTWYALGSCYASLADESLTWNAIEIVNSHAKITEFQKKSFLCFVRSAKILTWFPNHHAPTSPTEEINFWREFGYLVYSMTTEPMSMEAFKLNPDHSDIWRKPNPNDLYAFAAHCFGRALESEKLLFKKLKVNESNGNSIIYEEDWRLPYMLGKCYQKLGKSAESVLCLYKLAVDRTPEKSGIIGQERLVDTEYKLTSTLAKFMITSKIKPYFVEEMLSDNSGAPLHLKPSDKDPGSFNMERPEYQYAYNLISSRIADIRKMDKNKWQHRPVFRHAWLTYHVERKSEEAKLILQNLFQLKVTSKAMMNVWKPEFERSGRHFVYVHQYIRFLIELARITLDVECLETISKKLAKASNIVLKEDIIKVELENAFKYVEREHQKAVLDGMQQQNSDNELNEQSNMMSVSALISQENDDSPINIGFGEPSSE
ncbi:418_t:CDS:10 [Entrophospora sp. SA101]|nr:15522_t:CDS:10 [Entrophospora sp. SA101]CAJ0925627.1 418_t:CDS:10 [Entrophospora sp. SA101]